MHLPEDYTLEFLLAFDGRIHCLEQGHWLKFEIGRTAPTPERPHGLRYSFTLHDRTGQRLLGFDNAHRVAPQGSRFHRPDTAHDHWHRTGDDEGRPYRFTTAEQLLVDFEAAVGKCLAERGLDSETTGGSAVTDRRSR